MIRDFCGISKNRLIDEIKELRKRVESGNSAPLGVHLDSVEAISSAKPQPDFIPAPIRDDYDDYWYVARNAREQRLAKLKSISSAKEAQKQLPPPATAS